MNKDTLCHVIKDPVHGTMEFTARENAWIKPWIDSPHFQRLRHIKQLGMGDFIFPGAVHTRFNHSLGCCYVARQIAHKIGLTEEDRQLVMLSALLHDIGHGPFSHTFEDLFFQKKIRHEAWTALFLADYRSEAFFAQYNRINPWHPLTEEKFTLIEQMITHQSPGKRLLADIVSSQLDADRLDYLLRDNHFCGVRYGQFDFHWMLNSMTVVNSHQGERLGLTHKGIGVVEHYLMARRLMTRNIYFHQKKLALEFFLIQLLQLIAQTLDHTPELKFIGKTRLGQFLLAVNQFNQATLSSPADKSIQAHFLKEQFSTYKELCDYDVFILIKSLAEMKKDSAIHQLAERIQHRCMPKIIRLDNVNLTPIENNLKTFKEEHPSLQDWQIALIKTPHQSYTVDEDPILIINELGQVRPLDELSLMIHAMGDKLEHSAFLCIDQVIHNLPIVSKFIKNLSN